MNFNNLNTALLQSEIVKCEKCPNSVVCFFQKYLGDILADGDQNEGKITHMFRGEIPDHCVIDKTVCNEG